MENAVDALKLAAAILIFIIAIATSFSLFGTAKQTADDIIMMRDKQAYLDEAELDNGILYTSSSVISGGNGGDPITTEYVTGVTKNGDRVVKIDDVVSTITRYSREKYGVTIADEDGNVIVRFDSNTESLMTQYKNDQIEDSAIQTYIGKLAENTKNIYENIKYEYGSRNNNTLYNIYGDCGTPWYGNDEQIQRRIHCDLYGTEYEYNKKTYEGKGILEKLIKANQIIEITKEIDRNKYLKETIEDAGVKKQVDTSLIQQYNIPTLEIIYIIYLKGE